ncbi:MULTISPECIES: hypothetical protein [Rhodococcus]|uniref:hypothetical protein n=1 Tax=Rhodococcus TaxID=1827 RepID=UPI0002D22504|nr:MULTISPECIES: hypothetical protein [Rhodococcus]AXY49695.1 hypothetical protein YT1_0238 [Rhodococcus ruber]MBD8057062.1 hypothetical protein [Rhodococcus ruber]MCF8784650.1 hypothetical protein [Rhodococcus ruber]MCZ1075640.1 hypothetical protein [Rhodococcus sp. A5(2022)]MCZ4506281.1 hypothetical protein [Rhodococcus ruber]
MSPTTDRNAPQRSPALRSKIASAALSGGAVLALVTGMAVHTPDTPPARTADPAGSNVGVPSAAPGTSADRPVPAAIPAPSTSRGAVTAPQAISRGSGG